MAGSASPLVARELPRFAAALSITSDGSSSCCDSPLARSDSRLTVSTALSSSVGDRPLPAFALSSPQGSTAEAALSPLPPPATLAGPFSFTGAEQFIGALAGTTPARQAQVATTLLANAALASMCASRDFFAAHSILTAAAATTSRSQHSSFCAPGSAATPPTQQLARLKYAVVQYRFQTAIVLAPFRVCIAEYVVVDYPFSTSGEILAVPMQHAGVVLAIFDDYPGHLLLGTAASSAPTAAHISRRMMERDRNLVASYRRREHALLLDARRIVKAAGLPFRVEVRDSELQFDGAWVTYAVALEASEQHDANPLGSLRTILAHSPSSDLGAEAPSAVRGQIWVLPECLPPKVQGSSSRRRHGRDAAE